MRKGMFSLVCCPSRDIDIESNEMAVMVKRQLRQLDLNVIVPS
jgi:hypothetical protein